MRNNQHSHLQCLGRRVHARRPFVAGAFALFCTFLCILSEFRATAIAMVVPGEIEHSLDQCLDLFSISARLRLQVWARSWVRLKICRLWVSPASQCWSPMLGRTHSGLQAGFETGALLKFCLGQPQRLLAQVLGGRGLGTSSREVVTGTSSMSRLTSRSMGLIVNASHRPPRPGRR